MGSKSTQTTTRTPYDAAAVASANSTLAGANTQAQNTMGQLLPGITQRIQSQIAVPASPYQVDARTQLDKTINGDYLNPATNPYSAGMADLIAKRTQGNYDATFGASGRTHGGLSALLSGQGVADALGSFYGGLYNQERGNQQQAIGMAPAFNADEYAGTNNLLNETNAAASMPLNLANSYGQGVTAINAPYTTDTQVQKTPFGIQQAIGLAAMVGGAATGNPMLMSSGAGMAGGGQQSMGAAQAPYSMPPSAYPTGLLGGGGSMVPQSGGFAPMMTAYPTSLPGLPRFLG
jgi:hypothetical protein